MSEGYRERRPVAALVGVADSVWAKTAASGAAAGLVVPDGCMDLVWDGAHLLFAGPDTRAWSPAPAPGGVAVGIRLRPGRGSLIVGASASGLLDTHARLGELGPPMAAWEDELAAEASTAGVAAVLERLVQDRLRTGGDPDPVVDAGIDAVRGWQGPGLVRALSDQLGVGERQLLRRFRSAVGYGPKYLHTVSRFQRFLGMLAAEPDRDLALASALAGYADQAHLTRDAVALAGRSPGRLRDRARQTSQGAARPPVDP